MWLLRVLREWVLELPHLHANIYTCMCIHVKTHPVNTCMYLCVYIYIYMIYTYTCIYIYTLYVYVCIYTVPLSLYTNIYVYIYITRMHIGIPCVAEDPGSTQRKSCAYSGILVLGEDSDQRSALSLQNSEAFFPSSKTIDGTPLRNNCAFTRFQPFPNSDSLPCNC